jgi:GTP-binding protein Era
MTDNTVFHSGYIAIVGRPNVGKSTLLNHLIGQKISITSRKAQTTRHRITGILTEESTQFVFVDTPGFQTQYLNTLNKGLNKVVTSSLRDVNVVLFVIEARHFDERDRLVMNLLPKNAPVLLVINKVDNMEDKGELLPFIQSIAQEHEFTAIVPVSAKHDKQLDTLLDAIRPFLPEGEKIYPDDEITDRRNCARKSFPLYRRRAALLGQRGDRAVQDGRQNAPHTCGYSGGQGCAQGHADRQERRKAQGNCDPVTSGYGKAV